ncbi:GH1 family beta-glucosidase [Paradevosia shaoguanensis]|uniref:Beta-glucosidase n=1 Tax=Paradevosia shaoguanensis TaxID=1335043 RepID=A0AA41QK85_9HYPH|nr:GH1 family beta-glucosidase [Paradevosia shaoguanensis]MCF1741555.1 GH1 family beta-glucosidase [Paradevosia shaoguanensis]MCI0126038.1 GH1 family beta-glucosidase [Paradevosia shaoguanensis]
MFSVDRKDFGPNFVFGAATAAYQIEGGQIDGRGTSIWDTFSATPGNVKNADSGLNACDHYHRWPEDLDLIRDAGFDGYRFSFAWPRLIPAGTGAVNQAGIDFYDRLIDGMLERGIKPFATLYHWDLPSPLQDKGGWMNRDIASAFGDYASLVAQKFGDRLSAIATINEPWCVAFLSHFLGIHAPGYRDVRAAARAMHYVLLAHGTGIDALRAEGAKNLGIVLNLEKSEPASDKPEDLAATNLGDAIFNRWYLGGLFKGQYPEELTSILEPYLPEGFERDMPIVSRPLDWLGINYYTRGLYRASPSTPIFPIAKAEGALEANDLGWEIYPQGLTDLLVRVSTEYTKVPIYVTENGMSEDNDERRIAYYDAHLKAVVDAQKRGADVRGYFAWSLLDNYEWAEGYSSRFGIVHVDYATQKRTPKGSYRSFQGMLHNTR